MKGTVGLPEELLQHLRWSRGEAEDFLVGGRGSRAVCRVLARLLLAL